MSDPMKRPIPPPMKLDPIYVPFGKDKEPPGAEPAKAYLLPEGVEPQPVVEPPPDPRLTLKSIELDLLPSEDGKRLVRQGVPKEAAEELAKLSAASGRKCWRCKGTGINGYKSKGTVIRICKCVREGAPLVIADEKVATQLEPQT